MARCTVSGLRQDTAEEAQAPVIVSAEKAVAGSGWVRHSGRAVQSWCDTARTERWWLLSARTFVHSRARRPQVDMRHSSTRLQQSNHLENIAETMGIFMSGKKGKRQPFFFFQNGRLYVANPTTTCPLLFQVHWVKRSSGSADGSADESPGI